MDRRLSRCRINEPRFKIVPTVSRDHRKVKVIYDISGYRSNIPYSTGDIDGKSTRSAEDSADCPLDYPVSRRTKGIFIPIVG